LGSYILINFFFFWVWFAIYLFDIAVHTTSFYQALQWSHTKEDHSL